jgi:membrane protease YdiL (CAAX protease family)
VPRIVVNVLVIFVVSQVIAILIVELMLGVLGKSSNIDNSLAAQFFYVLLAEGLALAAVVWLVKRRRLSFSTIGLGRKPKLADLMPALIGFVSFYLLLVIVSLIVSALYPDINKGNQDVGFNSISGSFQNLIAFISLVIIPPLGEEPLVRGYLYSGLRGRYKFVPAMILTSLLFGAAHLLTGSGPGLLWSAALNTFVLSVILVYLREHTGALYAGMIVHALNNAVAFGFHFHS